METNKSIKGLWKNDRQLFINIIILIAFSCVSLIVLGSLIGTQVLDWTWITGFILGVFFSITSLWSIRASGKVVAKTQNWLFYMFLFVARLALYFIPLLLAAFLPDIFKIFGVLWGFIPLCIVPLSGTIPAFHNTFSKKAKLLSQVEKN